MTKQAKKTKDLEPMVDVGMKFTLRLTQEQKAIASRHAGARRFAFNWCVENNRRLVAEHKKDSRVKRLYSGFDNLHAFNKWKISVEAGRSEHGVIGLPWRHEVLQGVFEEGAKDFAKGLRAAITNVIERRKKITKRKVGFPDFQSRFRSAPTFCFRNTDGKRFKFHPTCLEVPKLGRVRVRESLRPLRRLLQPRHSQTPARITAITFHEKDGYWRIAVALKVPASRMLVRKPKIEVKAGNAGIFGCDVGLRTLVTVADAAGKILGEFRHPESIARYEKDTRKLHRRVALKRESSKARKKAAKARHRVVGSSEKRARAQLNRRYARQRFVRTHHWHQVSNFILARSHAVGLEDLPVASMLKTRMFSRAIAQAAWGQFRRMMTYKAQWAGIPLVEVDRYFPSTKRCSECLEREASVSLEVTQFACSACGYRQGRDINAAINLARYTREMTNPSSRGTGDVKTPAPCQVEEAAEVPRGWLPVKRATAYRRSNGTARPLKTEGAEA